jgi:hypothetical protein
MHTLTASSLSSSTLTDKGNVTSALQGNVGFKLLLCSF